MTIKTFKNIRETLSEQKMSGKSVFKKSMGGVKVQINQDDDGFSVYIDGEYLDTYDTQKEAESTAKEFIDQL